MTTEDRIRILTSYTIWLGANNHLYLGNRTTEMVANEYINSPDHVTLRAYELYPDNKPRREAYIHFEVERLSH